MRAVCPFGRKRLTQSLIAALGALSGLPLVVDAAELGFGLGYVGEYSTNIMRSRSDEQQGWTHTALAGAVWRELTTDLEANVQALAEYRDYPRDTFTDESVGTVDGLLLWHISPKRLTWTVEDSYRQVQLNPALADTPDNRAAANVLSTGPDAYLRFSTVNTLQLGGRYGRVTVEDSRADNSSGLGYARWLYQSSPSTTLSLNYEQLKVDNEDDVFFPDFTRYDTFVGLHRLQAVSELTIEAGATRIEQDGREDVDGSRLRFGWLAQLTSDTAVGVTLRQEYSDTSAELLSASRFVTEAPTVPAEPSALAVAVSGDVFYERSAEAFYRYTGVRYGWIASAFGRDLDFETRPDDRTERGVRLDVQQFTSADLVSSLFGSVTHTEFEQLAREDDDSEIGARFAYRQSRDVLFGFEVRHLSRDSDERAFDYDENRVLLSVLYNTNSQLPALTRH
jgi:hypothetical protein